jgi:lipopolysaccharide heptosyltransferase II
MTEIRRILFITLSNIGDVILTTPVFSALRHRFPRAAMTVMVGPRASSVFSGSPDVDEIFVYDKETSLLGKARFVMELRRMGFDLVADLRNTLIPFLVGAPYRTPLFRRHLKGIFPKREQHLACLHPLCGALGLDLESVPPFRFFSEIHRDAAEKKLRARGIAPQHLVILAPGAQSAVKRWTLEGFAELADMLARGQGRSVILVGSEADGPVADAITRRSCEQIFDLTGETSFPEAAALFSTADLVVANDSAPLQLAYAMGVPAVGIFGPTDERKFGRTGEKWAVLRKALPCAPCEAAQCLISEVKKCLLEIEPAEVYETCTRLLAPKETHPHAATVL